MVDMVLVVDLCGVRACAKCGTAERKDDGRCKACAAAYHLEYRQANQEKVAAKQREWRLANLRKAAAYQREWQQANREKIAAYQRKWRLAKVAKKAALEANNEP